MDLKPVLVGFGVLTLFTAAHAGPSRPDLKSPTRVRVVGPPETLPSPAQPAKPVHKPATNKDVKFGFSAAYVVRTDLADTSTPRLYSHQFTLGAGFEHPSHWSAGVDVSAAYE